MLYEPCRIEVQELFDKMHISTNVQEGFPNLKMKGSWTSSSWTVSQTCFPAPPNQGLAFVKCKETEGEKYLQSGRVLYSSLRKKGRFDEKACPQFGCDVLPNWNGQYVKADENWYELSVCVCGFKKKN